jgi:heat shock protein HslJ
MRRSLTIAGAALLVAAAAGGCGWNDDIDSRSATAGLPSTRADLEARDWVLDRTDSSLTVDDEGPVTLTIVGDEVSGTAPCNTYRGTFELGRDDSVEIRDVVLTRRACEPQTMDAEDEYVTALERADHVEVEVDEEGRDDRDRMTLTGPDELRLDFGAFDGRDALIGDWTVVNVATGDAIESVLTGTEPTLSFSDDGNLSVATGCNTAVTDWELDGDELTLDPIATTLRACSDPPGVMDQEAAILAALDATSRVEVTPGSLSLLDDDGRTVLVAVQE